jgi:alpha-methylacyl-CoA racemase
VSVGPLQGLRIIEFAGIGPAPFAAMMLADHGAEVIRIERPGGAILPFDALCRSRRSIVLNMKSREGIGVIRDLARTADGLIEGYRPGVMERLGVGPEVLLADNARLVYGRMTGWGQDGPLAQAAGHDINYISVSGLLHTIGTADKPMPPINYVGDFGGGGMMLAFGMVSAMLAVREGALGQVVDAAMTEGSAILGSFISGLLAGGIWQDKRGVNLLDGGAPYYDTYPCADGRWVSVGTMEPQFYALLLEKLGLADDPLFEDQNATGNWPAMHERLREVFATRTRAEWCAMLEGTDACFAPVLSLSEAPAHPHSRARSAYVDVGGHLQPAPAPRYSVTGTQAPRPPCAAGADTDDLLAELGRDAATIARLRKSGAVC